MAKPKEIEKRLDAIIYDTGKRIKHDKKEVPVFSAKIRNGMHYRDRSSGLLLPVDLSVLATNDYEFTHKVDKARAILRFGDSSGNNKQHLCGIEDENGNWLNMKLDRVGYGMTGSPGGKPTFAGEITVEHIPTYKGIKTNYRLGKTGINEIIVTLKYNPELTPEQRGNEIVFNREGKEVFVLPTPFAYDEGAITETDSLNSMQSVSMDLDKVSGFDAVRLSVDSAWLSNAIDPVIDPSITIRDGIDGNTIEDAWLYEPAPDYNYGKYGTFWIAANDVDSRGAVTQVKLPDLGIIEILNAKFSLNAYGIFGTAPGINVYRVLKQWNGGDGSNRPALTGEVTFNSARHNEQLWSIAGCRDAVNDYDTFVGSVDCPVTGWKDLPLNVSVVQDWYDNPGLNNGVVFKEYHYPDSTGHAVYWFTAEHSTDPLYFYMEYTEAGGAEIINRRRNGY